MYNYYINLYRCTYAGYHSQFLIAAFKKLDSRNVAVSLNDQLYPQCRTHVDRDFAGKKPETRNSKKLLKMYKLELLQVHMCLVSFPDPQYWGGLTEYLGMRLT